VLVAADRACLPRTGAAVSIATRCWPSMKKVKVGYLNLYVKAYRPGVPRRWLGDQAQMVSTGRKGSESPKPDGPKTASASGVRIIGGVETAITLTRWP
jgi:hypothetical protein